MKARRLIGGGTLVAALSVVIGGCVVEVDFDPLGDDFSASGEWTINGGPANDDTCAAAGVETVELVFFHEGSPYRYSELSFRCSAGGFATDKIFSYGSYTTQWWALDAGGARIYESPMRPLVVNAPIEHANLAPFDIEAAVVPTLTVYFQWDTDPSAGGTSFADCTTAGVANFSYMLTPAGGGANYDAATAIACEAGLTWEDIPPGTYRIYVEGEDGGGVKRWMATCTDLVVAGTGLSEYTCQVTDSTGG